MRYLYLILCAAILTACGEDASLQEFPVVPGERVEINLDGTNYQFPLSFTTIGQDVFHRPADPGPGAVEENVLYLDRWSEDAYRHVTVTAQRLPVIAQKTGLPLRTGIAVPAWIALRVRSEPLGQGREILTWIYKGTLTVTDVTSGGVISGTLSAELETAGNSAPYTAPDAAASDLGIPGNNASITGTFRVSVTERFQ